MAVGGLSPADRAEERARVQASRAKEAAARAQELAARAQARTAHQHYFSIPWPFLLILGGVLYVSGALTGGTPPPASKGG